MPSSMAGPVRVLFQIRRIGTQDDTRVEKAFKKGKKKLQLEPTLSTLFEDLECSQDMLKFMTSGYQAVSGHTSLSQEERQEKLSQADLTSAKGGIRRRVDIVDNSEVEISNLEVETFQKHPDQVCLKGKRSSMVSRSRYLKKLPSELRMEMTLQWRRMNCLSLPTQTPSTKADLLLDDEVPPGYPDIVLILKLFTKVLVKQFPIDKK